MVNTSNKNLVEASKTNPCPHCGKPDWCYSLDELTVCKRGNEPATGWYKTNKQDKDGSYYYAQNSQKKPIRRRGERLWEYPTRDRKKFVRVRRIDDGEGNKDIKQQHWNGKNWVFGLDGIKREDIPIYNYEEVENAIDNGQMIFICEGEPCADALIRLGFIATTNIGGSGKWRESDTNDLAGAIVCLIPDRDKPGMKHMEQIAQNFPDAKWLYPYPESFAWQNLPESNGLDVADWIADFNLKANDILDAITEKKQTVTGDTSKSGDTSKIDTVSFTDTVTTVTAILREAYPDWQEQQELDKLSEQTEMSKKAFWQLVAGVKCHLEEIQPEDHKLFQQLIDWHDTKLDVEAILPHMGKDIIHDAKVLNIDPVAILHPLLPAVLSQLSNQVTLDVESHQEPPVLYTCLVGESGTGKSRGQKLVFSPLEKLQVREKKRFDEECDEYKKALEAKEQAEKPIPQRKYLFKVSTIQAVIKRLADQGHGSIWSRDEIAGLFKSLDQFTNGSGEALEILLELWNSGVVQVDRVNEDDSFIVRDTCLSIYGGIQPGKFSSIFKDPDDANGLQARFLFAVISPQPAKRVKGYCRLAEKLPELYDWINNFGSLKLKLSEKADKRYTSIYEQIGTQAESSSLPAIRGWMRKLPAQILRIAIALHAIDCYFEQGRPKQEIQIDTLNKAIDLCRYYRNSFALVQEKASDSDNPASILWKIWDEAVKRPEGLLCRDAYRIVKAIQRRAKEVGRSVSAYTLDLFKQLEKQGWGLIQRAENKRTIRFVAVAKPDEPPQPPTGPPQPPTPPTEPPQPETEDTLKIAVDWIRMAISSREHEHALDISTVMKSICDEQPELRSQIWTALSEEERSKFKQLCKSNPEYQEVGLVDFIELDLIQLTAKFKVGDRVTIPNGSIAEVTTYIGFTDSHQYEIQLEDGTKTTKPEQSLKPALPPKPADYDGDWDGIRWTGYECKVIKDNDAFEELRSAFVPVRSAIASQTIADAKEPETATNDNEMLAKDMERALAKGLKIGDLAIYNLNDPDSNKAFPGLIKHCQIISDIYPGKREPLAWVKVRWAEEQSPLYYQEEEVQVRFLEKVELEPESTEPKTTVLVQDLPIGAIVRHKKTGNCSKIVKNDRANRFITVETIDGTLRGDLGYCDVEPLIEFAKRLETGTKLKAKKHLKHPFASTASSTKYGTIQSVNLSAMVAVVDTQKEAGVLFYLEAVEVIQ